MNIHVYLLVLLLAQGAPGPELVFLNLQSQQKCGPDLANYVINESQMWWCIPVMLHPRAEEKCDLEASLGYRSKASTLPTEPCLQVLPFPSHTLRIGGLPRLKKGKTK